MEIIEKIRKEIERRKKEIQGRISELGNFESGEIGLYNLVDIYDELLAFLDSLQEEALKDLEEEISKYTYKKLLLPITGTRSETMEITEGDWVDAIHHFYELDKSSCPKVSDNLEEAAEEYATNAAYSESDSIYWAHRDGYIAGWNGHAEKCQGCFDRDEVFFKGMKHAKEQMMKEAVEGTIVEDMLVSEKLHRVESEYLDRYVGQGGNLKGGQKVKLYVFKED